MGIVHAKTVSADRKDDIFVKFNKLPVQVQRVIVDGLTRTKDDVIVKEIKTLLGAKTFDELVQLSYNAKVKMEKLGLFENVVIAIDVSKDKRENGYEVMFEVQEFRRVDGGVQTTFGDNDGCLDFQIKMPNMLGRGEQFSLVYTLGTRKTQKYSASFQKPLNNNPDLFFGWTAYQFHGDFPWSGYQETDKGTAFSFTFRTLMGSHSLQWEGIWRDLRALSRDTSFAVREQSGNSLKSSVKMYSFSASLATLLVSELEEGKESSATAPMELVQGPRSDPTAASHTFSIDSRDDTVLPTAGTLWQTSQEYSGLGGNVEYAKQNGIFQWNVSLPWDTVFQVSLAGGIMKSLDPQASVAICDKFFLGGPLTLRGFSLKSCGPHSHDDALGAESYWLAAAHIYSPLPFRPAQGRFGDLFKAHFFINAGNLGTMDFHNLSSSVCQMASTLRWSYGLGIVLCMSGTARLELNYVIPMRIQKGDKACPGLQFGIGIQFL